MKSYTIATVEFMHSEKLDKKIDEKEVLEAIFKYRKFPEEVEANDAITALMKWRVKFGKPFLIVEQLEMFVPHDVAMMSYTDLDLKDEGRQLIVAFPDIEAFRTLLKSPENPLSDTPADSVEVKRLH